MSKSKIIVLLLCALCLSVNGLAQGQPPVKPEPQEIKLSPTATLEAYYAAADRKDFAVAKKYLSRGTLKMMEDGAKKMGKTLDEAMTQEAPQDNQRERVKFINEKIDGETATVDIVTISEPHISATMPFVIEDGQWKMAMDKMLENMANPNSK